MWSVASSWPWGREVLVFGDTFVSTPDADGSLAQPNHVEEKGSELALVRVAFG
jgi:hypothetical protein